MLCANIETGWSLPDLLVDFFFSLCTGHIFHNLMVSSAATLATVLLSGEVHSSRTREVCPVRSATCKCRIIFKEYNHCQIKLGQSYKLLPLATSLEPAKHLWSLVISMVSGLRKFRLFSNALTDYEIVPIEMWSNSAVLHARMIRESINFTRPVICNSCIAWVTRQLHI